MRIFVNAILLIFTALTPIAAQTALDRHESERSDKLTGGRVQTAEFEPNEPDIHLTLNVPSFRLTLWQNGKEVKSYFVGVGLKNFPIYIGPREINEIIWNPAWVPPPSAWVRERGVRPGQYIGPGSSSNPLGKMKIPLGDNYLLHQAASPSDLGSLVSHGCVRMLRADIYDLAEKIVAARALPVSQRRINAAKNSSRTFAVRLDEPVPMDINYDTLVVEDGVLHIYPDVYDRGTNRAERLRAELRASGIKVSRIDDSLIEEMFAKVTRKTQFVVGRESIESGRALEDGELLPLIPKAKAATKKSAPKKRQR